MEGQGRGASTTKKSDQNFNNIWKPNIHIWDYFVYRYTGTDIFKKNPEEKKTFE